MSKVSILVKKQEKGVMMENQYDTIRLEIRDYISPECSCKIEDMVNSFEHVAESTFGTYSGLGSMSGDVVKQNNRTTSNRNFCKIGIISSISRI